MSDFYYTGYAWHKCQQEDCVFEGGTELFRRHLKKEHEIDYDEYKKRIH